MENRAMERGTRVYGERMTDAQRVAEAWREGRKVRCPVCGGKKSRAARTCQVCSGVLRQERNFVKTHMVPVVGLAAQMARFRAGVARAEAELERWRRWYEARGGGGAPPAPPRGGGGGGGGGGGKGGEGGGGGGGQGEGETGRLGDWEAGWKCAKGGVRDGAADSEPPGVGGLSDGL